MENNKDKEKLFISATDTIVVFENKLLENITTTHHVVPFVIFIPVISYFIYETISFIYSGSIQQPLFIIPLIISAILLWTFTEYIIHRFVFHAQLKSKFGKKFLYLMHGAHHDYPNDPRRLVVPPLLSVSGGIVFYTLSYLFLGRYLAAPFFASLVTSYLIYDWFHYASHHLKINNSHIRMLIKQHLLHHYKDPKKGYGFTTTLWDMILRTKFKK